MEIKHYDRPGKVAWSNSKLHNELLSVIPYEPTEDSLYDIDILSVDLATKGTQLSKIGNGFYSIPFSSIAWGTHGC